MRHACAAIIVALLITAPHAASGGVKPQASASIIRHDDFESDSTGAMPNGWSAQRSLKDGYRIEVSTAAARMGHNGLALSIDHWPGMGVSFGAVSVRIPAQPYRGRRIRFEGWGRFEALAGQRAGTGQFWLRIDRSR